MKTKFLRITTLHLTVIMLIFSLFGCTNQPILSNSMPEYSGVAYTCVNGNIPFFTDEELTLQNFEYYSFLDALGRCGVAFACLGPETMPTEERESIASISPSGWEYWGVSNNNSYDFIEDNYVYNRCHLIGFQLAGENDNELNLITGTRYMNIEGMLPFENLVADYIRESRVTPIFDCFNLVADGVLMEAFSVEDSGEGICFCIFAYNVQPGVWIDYFTGVNIPAELMN